MEAHIDDVCLGTNTQEDLLILLGEFFAVCQENHTRLKLEKCEFMQETMHYLGSDVGCWWWTPAASKAKPLMDAKTSGNDFMVYAVSLGRATSIAAISKPSPTPAPF